MNDLKVLFCMSVQVLDARVFTRQNQYRLSFTIPGMVDARQYGLAQPPCVYLMSLHGPNLPDLSHVILQRLEVGTAS